MQPLEKKDVEKIIADYLESSGFTQRKLTDSPSDNLQVVNRKYVNLYGSVLQRPTLLVPGQQYFDTSVNYPIFRRGDGAWVSSSGSVVG